MALPDPKHERPVTRTPRKAAEILAPGEMPRLIAFSVFLLIIVPAIAWFAGGNQAGEAVSWRPDINIDAFNRAPLVTRIHAVFIMTLAVAGWIMILLPKGDARHKMLGWIWVLAMAAMASSSLLVPHSESWVAAYFGGGSAIALMVYGVYSARKRNFATHGKMTAILMIALVLMMILSILPGRLMHQVFFSV